MEMELGSQYLERVTARALMEKEEEAVLALEKRVSKLALLAAVRRWYHLLE
jgi:hypothetical protein